MPSTSEVSIHPVESAADIASGFQILSETFGPHPMFRTFYPAHWTPGGRAQATKRMTEEWEESKHQNPPALCMFKAVQSNKIIGFAIWAYVSSMRNTVILNVDDAMDEAMIDSLWGATAPDRGVEVHHGQPEKQKEFARQMWRGYHGPRHNALLEAEKKGRNGIWVLEMLATKEEFQRRGAGALLTQWGVDMAKEEGTDAVIEATPKGTRCYQKCGFYLDQTMDMRAAVSDEFKSWEMPELYFFRIGLSEESDKE